VTADIDAAGIAEDKKGFLFRTSRGHGGTALADQPMAQADAWRMVRKRAIAAGIMAPIGNHSSRATGITAYLPMAAHSTHAIFITTTLENGAQLEDVQKAAGHRDPSTTKLYDRRRL
jgi:integrase/recombinase XerD